MRIGLVSYRCENRNIAFNISQIERAMKEAEGKADLLCFGEAFLQGFDSLCWDYETDRNMAAGLSSETFDYLRLLTVRYGIDLLTGYIEIDHDRLYSSCAVLSEGKTVHNYRRVSKGWKEYSLTDSHYCEGTEIKEFRLHGKDMMIALCGDLFEFPERFRTDHLLIWPVYVNYTAEEWEAGMLDEYAAQAEKAASDTLMINSIDHEPVCRGGSFLFHKGTVSKRIPFDSEEILIVQIS